VQYTLGDLARLRGDDARARDRYETSLVTLREHGDRRCIASTLASLAAVLLRRAKPDRADLGLADLGPADLGLADLGLADLGLADLGLAREQLLESLSIRRDVGDQAGVAECLEGYAAVALATGDAEGAARVLGAADEQRAATGAARPASDEQAQIERVRAIREALGEDRLRRAWSAGQAYGGDRIAAELLAGSGH
jgi:uncharacterized protein YjbI with pentapeptide repeats